MAETTPSLKEQLKAAEAEIEAIEKITAPLYAKIQEAWAPVEKAKAKYNAIKEEALAKIREAQGAHERAIVRQPSLDELQKMVVDGSYKPGDPIPAIHDSTPWSRLHDLKRTVAELYRAGAHRD